MPINEADTCRTYVVPKLYSAGWEDTQISEQKSFTDGRIMLAGNRAFRRPQKRADYLLRYRRDFPSLSLRRRQLIGPQVTGCNKPRNTLRFWVSSLRMQRTATASSNTIS